MENGITYAFRLILAVVIVPFLLHAHDKTPVFDNLTINDGLTSSDISAICQDYEGYIWLGTYSDGLIRYDGYNFEVFRHHPGDSASLSSNNISSLLRDSCGRLWIGTLGGGLNLFRPGYGTFRNFTTKSTSPDTIVDNRIYTLFQDHSGYLWIGTHNGLSRFELNSDTTLFIAPKFENYRQEPGNPYGLRYNRIQCLTEDHRGRLWIGTGGGGINIYDPETDTFHHSDNSDSDHPLWHTNRETHFAFGQAICYTTMENRPVIVYGTADNLYFIDAESQQLIRQNRYASDPYAAAVSVRSRALLRSTDSTIWQCTEGLGLFIYEKDGQSCTQYKHSAINGRSLVSNLIYCIYKDATENIWLGTDKGLSVFKPLKYKFPFSSLDPNDHKKAITALCPDGNIIWLGTDNASLIAFDQSKNNYKKFLLPDVEPGSSTGSKITDLNRDPQRKNMLWIISNPGGLFSFNKITNKWNFHSWWAPDTFFVDTELRKHRWSNSQPTRLLFDHEGYLWLTGYGGLYKYDTAADTFHVFLNYPPDEREFYGRWLTNLCFAYGDLWVGTLYYGLYRFDPGTGTYAEHISYENTPESAVHTRIYALLLDTRNRLWIGSDHGLGYVRQDQSGSSAVKALDTFNAYNITGIAEGQPGTLWLTSNQGLIRYEPDSEAVQFFDMNDGLFTRNLSHASIFAEQNGNIYIGIESGFHKFASGNIPLNRYLPPVAITDIKIFNRSVLTPDEGKVKRLERNLYTIDLSYSESVFSIHFAAFDYIAPPDIQYAYKMDGVDPDWVYPEPGQRTATYTQLDPGKYHFKVIASNSDGLWNRAGAEIFLSISPPWWKSGFAYFIFGTLILLGLIGSWKLNTRRLRIRHQFEIEHLKAEKLAELDRIKSRLFTNISHEFRTPLTLIEAPVKQFLSGNLNGNLRDHFQVILRNAQRLMHLVQQLLDLSRIEAGQMQLRTEKMDMRPVLKILFESFESVAQKRGILFKFLFDQPEILLYIDKDKFEKIILNLLSNAFKFTPDKGMIELHVEVCPVEQIGTDIQAYFTEKCLKTEEFTVISVRNTGSYIPEEELTHIFKRFYKLRDDSPESRFGTGIGLSLVKELVELHHGYIGVQSNKNRETRFSVYFPMGKAHLAPAEITSETVKRSKRYSKPPITHLIDPIETDRKSEINRSNQHSVIVIDDNQDIRHYIAELLSTEYKVIEAADGNSGIALAIKHNPDLIISDVLMPVTDGYDLCYAIKNDIRTSHIPVMLLTAMSSEDEKRRGLEIGADEYIIKPFAPDELLLRVRNMIVLRERMRENLKNILDGKFDFSKYSSADQNFLMKLQTYIDNELSDPDLKIEQIAEHMHISNTTLIRKLHALVNLSPTAYLRQVRLKKAHQLLHAGAGSISEIGYKVGFNSPSYFSRCYREYYGILPSQEIRERV